MSFSLEIFIFVIRKPQKWIISVIFGFSERFSAFLGVSELRKLENVHFLETVFNVIYIPKSAFFSFYMI